MITKARLFPAKPMLPTGRRAGPAQDADRIGVAGFIDVETTGLNPRTDEVVELALILFQYHRSTGEILGIADEYVGLREPSRPIPRTAMQIHGITADMVRNQRLDHVKVDSMLDLAEFLVAHNAAFDRGFVTPLFPRSAAKHWLCSMSGVDWKGFGHPSRGLQRLLQDHGIRVSQAHRGAADAKAALKLLSLRGPHGHYYFLDLLRRSERSRAQGDWREAGP